MTPNRVVSLLASSTEMVAALGCGERLVGRSHECDHPEWVRRLPAVTGPKLAIDLPSADLDARVRALVEQALSVYRVDARALAALEPELVITQTQCEVCAVSLRDVEEALAHFSAHPPRVVALRPDTLADVWRDVRRVADALGVPERGVQLVSRLRQRMSAVAARCAARGPRPRVAMIEWIEPLMAAGNWMPDLVTLAGGINLFGEAGRHSPWMTWEALVASDPDVIVVSPCGFGLERTRSEMPALTGRAEWPALRAVAARRVYLADGNAYFHRPGPRLVESLEILAEMLHPAVFDFGHRGTGWAALEEAA